MYRINKIDKERKRMTIIRKIISVILYIIIIPIIIFNFTIIIKALVNKNSVPDFFGYKNFIIVSGSMEPTIMTGDAIFVKKVPEDELEVNDIISFQDGSAITTHRIISIDEENGVKKYRTKGDNNNTEDKEQITYKEIEGKYQFKISGFGKIVQLLQSKITLVILILLLVLNYWYSSRLDKKRLERKVKRKQYKLERKNKK